MIQKLNKLIEELTHKGTFTSMIAIFAIYLLLKLYLRTHGK
jgi:hypothetical protein